MHPLPALVIACRHILSCVRVKESVSRVRNDKRTRKKWSSKRIDRTHLNITGCKDGLDGRLGGSRNGDDVAVLVGLDLVLDELDGGDVT